MKTRCQCSMLYPFVSSWIKKEIGELREVRRLKELLEFNKRNGKNSKDIESFDSDIKALKGRNIKPEAYTRRENIRIFNTKEESYGNKEELDRHSKGEELTLQQLSSEVSGKA